MKRLVQFFVETDSDGGDDSPTASLVMVWGDATHTIRLWNIDQGQFYVFEQKPEQLIAFVANELAGEQLQS